MTFSMVLIGRLGSAHYSGGGRKESTAGNKEPAKSGEIQPQMNEMNADGWK
jgi:hypothetical protein